MGDQQQALTVRQVAGLVLRSDISINDAAKALAPLAPPQQALAIANAFNKAMDGEEAGDASNAAEHHGRRIEAIMDELPDFQAPFKEMIEAGDTEVVLSMVKGRVGDISSAAQYLDARLVALLFEKDPDMHNSADVRAVRLVNMTWTLVMETPVEHAGINVFFLATETGHALVRELRDMAADGDEDTQQILRNLQDREHHLPSESDDAE